MLFYSSSQNPKKIYHGTTVLNNDKKCLISKSEWFLKNHVTRKIRVMVLKKALHHRNTLHFKILKQKTVILNILLFWLYPINVALVSRRDVFNLTDPKPLKRSVFIIKQRSSSQSISETHYTRCDCLKKLSPMAMISTPEFFILLAAAMASSWDFPSVNRSRNCGVLGRAPTSSFRLFSRACMRAWPEI